MYVYVYINMYTKDIQRNDMKSITAMLETLSLRNSEMQSSEYSEGVK